MGKSETERRLRREPAFAVFCLLAFAVIGCVQFPEVFTGRLAWDERLGEYIPWRVEAARLLGSGELPFFTERVFGGMPVLALGYTGVFYPPNWLYVFMSPKIANVLAVLHTVIGGMGMLFYLRSRRLSRFPAFAGAILFITGTFGLCHTSHVAMREAAMLAPWVAWAAWRMGRGNMLGRVPMLACPLALQVTAGYPQITLFSVIWIGIDWLARAAFTRRFARQTAALAIAGVAALLLVAPLVLASAGTLSTTVRANLLVEKWLESPFPPGHVLLFFNPAAFGFPNTEWRGAMWPGEVLITINAAGWAMALAALPLWMLARRRSSLRVRGAALLLAGLLISLILATGDLVPGYRSLFHVPPFSLFRIPARWLWLATTFASVLAALSLHALAGVRIGKRIAICAAAWAGTGLFTLIVAGIAGSGAENSGQPFGLLFGAGSLVHHLAALGCLAACCVPQRARVTAAVTVAVLCTVQYRLIANRTLPETIDAARMIGDEPHPLLADLPPEEVTRFYTFRLKDAHFNELTLPQNLAVYRGYRSLNGYCPPLIHREMGHFPKLAGDGGTWMRQEMFSDPAVLRNFAVSHLLLDLYTFRPEQGEELMERAGEDWRILGEAEGVVLLSLLKTSPRFHLAYAWRPESKPKPYLEQWWRSDPVVEERTILVKPPVDEGFPDPLTALGGGEVELLRSSGSSQTFRVLSEGPGLLVIRDAWWPGWRSRIITESGASPWRDVACAEGMLRAVAVSAGEQVVETRYEPPGWRKGLLLCLLGVLVLGMARGRAVFTKPIRNADARDD